MPNPAQRKKDNIVYNIYIVASFFYICTVVDYRRIGLVENNSAGNNVLERMEQLVRKEPYEGWRTA